MAQLPAKSPYRGLLEDADFRRWWENVRRGSLTTAADWLRRMGFIQKRFGKSPMQIASMSQREAVNFVMDVVSALEAEKRSGSYIANMVKPMKSWLDFNGKPIQQRIKIPGRGELTKVGDERPPTSEELGRVLNMADHRVKVACSLVAFSGVRIEILGDFVGKDGLEVRDFPEMKMSEGAVEFDRMPTMVVVRKTLSKTNNQFLTFLCSEGCEYLKQYLEWRMREGEELTPRSAILTPFKLSIAGQHMRTTNISDLMRRPIRDAGFPWRPYVLRRYFDTKLMMAEADGLILRDWRVFLMGHVGDIEHTYTLNKGLSGDVIEKMREAYGKAAEKYLMTSARKETVTRDQVIQTLNNQFLLLAGYAKDEISNLGDLSELTAEQVQDLVRKKSMQALGLNGDGRQKVIARAELRDWIRQGWEFVTTLPDDDVVIRLPG